MPPEAIQAIIDEQFSFDSFRWQRENKVRISESFRADGLERLLYKCPVCKKEGTMLGKGIHVGCNACGAKYELSEYGELLAADGADATFDHVPDWYRWEREEVKKELESGTYLLDTPVDIWISVDTKGVFGVGSGRLVHSSSGFTLTSDDGEINYEQKPLYSHSICADFNFYEVGDIIALSGTECIYYCFPKNKDVAVAKARLAAEELYKMARIEHDKHRAAK
jgi:hypothetical protein